VSENQQDSELDMGLRRPVVYVGEHGRNKLCDNKYKDNTQEGEVKTSKEKQEIVEAM